MRICTIHNPIEVINLKVKHFYDYINYLLNKSRDKIKFPHENHLTLLERIAFRIKDGNMVSSTKKVINFYLENDLFNTQTDVLIQKNKLSQFVRELKSIEIDNPNFEKKLYEIIEKLNGKIGLNGNQYFKNILDTIIPLLNCNCTIELLKSEIEYYTNLLVSEFLRKGFEAKDLIGIHGFLYRILSKKTDLTDREDDNIYSEFPMPANIEANRGKEGFKKEVEDFLANMDFQKQFEGLYTFFLREKGGRVLYKINNVYETENDFDVVFNGVRFFNRNQIIVNTEYWEQSYIDEFNEFIGEKNTCLAETVLSFKTDAIGRQQAIINIREAIDFLNYVGKDSNTIKNGAILDTYKSYILYETYGNFSWVANNIQISNRLVNRTLNNLYPKGFDELSKSDQRILRWADKSLFKADSSVIWADRTLYLWRYLECLFSKFNGEQIIKKVSNVLLTRHLISTKNRLSDFIGNTLINSDEKTLKLTISKIALRNKIQILHEGKGDILDFRSIVNYPFLTEKFEDYKNVGSQIDYAKAYTFYRTLIWEAHEQRNAIIHQDIYCYSTIKKLNDYLFDIVYTFRVILVKRLIKNPSLCIEDAILELYEEGKVLRNV